MGKNKKFWNFQPGKSEQPPELILYGDISSSTWWGDEVTPQLFDKELRALDDAPEIVVRINSGGGDVFAAFGIYSRLKEHPAHISVVIDGWAASAATIIAMAGDTVSIPGMGIFMIHDPAVCVGGSFGKEALEKMAQELEVVKNCIVKAYAQKTGKSEEEISGIMAAETWYDGAKAVEAGFCDKLMFADVDAQTENAASRKMMVNAVSMDLSSYHHIPAELLEHRQIIQNRKESVSMEEQQKNQEIQTLEEWQARYPEWVREIENRAAQKERDRIQEIDDVALPGFEDLVKRAKYQDHIDAGVLARKILAQQKKAGAVWLNQREQDVEDSGVKEVPPSNMEHPGEWKGETAEETEIKNAIDKIFSTK